MANETYLAQRPRHGERWRSYETVGSDAGCTVVSEVLAEVADGQLEAPQRAPTLECVVLLNHPGEIVPQLALTIVVRAPQ